MFWKRVKAAEAAVGPSPEELAAAERASARLGRMVGRRREEAAEVAPDAAAIAARLTALHAVSPFFQLDVAMDASQAGLAAAIDDLAFAEDRDPQRLETARAELLAPRDRLRHELAWVPGLDAQRQAEVRCALRQGDLAALATLRLAAAGLARVNISLALLAGQEGEIGALQLALADALRWDGDESRDRIDEARQRAGFRPIDDQHFADALADRRRCVAEALAPAIAASREGRQLLAQAIAEHSGAIQALSAPMLEAVAAGYGALADPQLRTIQGRIAEALTALKANPRNPARITAIITAMDLWAQLRLPLQRLEQARGLDDLVSAELFDSVRDLAIVLSNEHKLFDESLRLSRALAHCFASVPALNQRVHTDLPTLIGNALSARFMQLLGKVRSQGREFGYEVARHGFGPGCGLTPSRVADLFEELTELDPNEESFWYALRELAVDMANRHGRRDVSLAIIEYMIDRVPPKQVHDRLVQDMCQLQPPRK